MPHRRTLALITACTLALTACGDGHDRDHNGDQNHNHGDHAGHDHTAKHGGALAPIGDHFAHVEVLVEDATMTIWVTGAEAQRPVRVPDASLTVTCTPTDGGEAFTVTCHAAANELSGETVGDTSQFTGEHERLAATKTFDGVIATITVKGTPQNNVTFSYPGGEKHDDH